MNTLNEIYSQSLNLYNKGKETLPAQLKNLPLKKAAVNSLLSFGAVMLLTGNAPMALTCAGCAAIATVIDKLLQPLFAELFEGASHFTSKSIRNGASMIAAASIISLAAGTSIPLALPVIAMIALNYLDTSNSTILIF